jgi:hypothetical protein
MDENNSSDGRQPSRGSVNCVSLRGVVFVQLQVFLTSFVCVRVCFCLFFFYYFGNFLFFDFLRLRSSLNRLGRPASTKSERHKKLNWKQGI